jgi:hypothetical protein
MNHSLEAHVNLAAADDLGHIGRVIRLQESNLEALFLEEALALGKVQGGMVGRSVPTQDGPLSTLVSQHNARKRSVAEQLQSRTSWSKR